MVLVKQMHPSKGHEESEMSKEQLLDLVCKLGRGKYFIVNTVTNEVIHDVKAIKENQAITIMPMVAGGWKASLNERR